LNVKPVYSACTEVLLDHDAARGLGPLGRATYRPRRHPPLHTNEQGCAGGVHVQWVERRNPVLRANGDLIKHSPRVHAMHVEACLKTLPVAWFGCLPATHMGFHCYGTTDFAGLLQKVGSYVEHLREAIKNFRLRLTHSTLD